VELLASALGEGRFRRVGEHLLPRIPFSIRVAKEDSMGFRGRVRCFQGDDFVGLEYVERIKSSKP